MNRKNRKIGNDITHYNFHVRLNVSQMLCPLSLNIILLANFYKYPIWLPKSLLYLHVKWPNKWCKSWFTHNDETMVPGWCQPDRGPHSKRFECKDFIIQSTVIRSFFSDSYNDKNCLRFLISWCRMSMFTLSVQRNRPWCHQCGHIDELAQTALHWVTLGICDRNMEPLTFVH